MPASENEFQFLNLHPKYLGKQKRKTLMHIYPNYIL